MFVKVSVGQKFLVGLSKQNVLFDIVDCLLFDIVDCLLFDIVDLLWFVFEQWQCRQKGIHGVVVDGNGLGLTDTMTPGDGLVLNSGIPMGTDEINFTKVVL